MKSEKPPLGIVPRNLWEERRMRDISNAIVRRLEAGHNVPKEWVEEYNYLAYRKRWASK